jgi:hypothetical protein
VTGFEVYKMYLALKNHFTKPDYDYVKYRGKTRASEKSFEQRNDVYFFKKLATKYSGETMLDYFVANFIFDSKGYLRNFSNDIYTQWKVHQESFTYKFKQDIDLLLEDVGFPYEENFDNLFHAKRGKHPILLKRYYASEINLETLVVFDHCLQYIDRVDKVLVDPMWKDTKLKVQKYQPFLRIDCKKYKKIILDTIREKL